LPVADDLQSGVHRYVDKCRSSNGKGMTTAFIGKTGPLTQKARVAVLARTDTTQLTALLTRAGHEAIEHAEWAALRTHAEQGTIDLVFCDEALAAELPTDVGAPVIHVTDRAGAQSSSTVPAVSLATLDAGLDAYLALATLLSHNLTRVRELERIVDGLHTGTAMVGRSPVMRRLVSAIARAADCDATVLIEGPNGAGKSLAARMIHCKSRRSTRPLLVVASESATADTLTKSLAEGKGATLVLENIDQLPPPAQSVLVRSLKERSTAHGSNWPRIVATTAAHLPELVARGAFREDLFYRLHAMPIVVPALRERTDDIQLLAQSIAEASSSTTGRASQFTPAALMLLEAMTWPGNVSQLEATVRRALLQAGGGPIEREHIQPQSHPAQAPTPRQGPQTNEPSEQPTEDSILPFEEEEQRMFSRALRATKGNVRRAAQLLGIGRATLYRKIQQYRLSLQ
jgi:DNA-binding NtrC family response regulator